MSRQFQSVLLSVYGCNIVVFTSWQVYFICRIGPERCRDVEHPTSLWSPVHILRNVCNFRTCVVIWMSLESSMAASSHNIAAYTNIWVYIGNWICSHFEWNESPEKTFNGGRDHRQLVHSNLSCGSTFLTTPSILFASIGTQNLPRLIQFVVNEGSTQCGSMTALRITAVGCGRLKCWSIFSNILSMLQQVKFWIAWEGCYPNLRNSLCAVKGILLGGNGPKRSFQPGAARFVGSNPTGNFDFLPFRRLDIFFRRKSLRNLLLPFGRLRPIYS